MEWRDTGGFENIDKATTCLKQQEVKNYKLNEFGDQLMFTGTNYFPYIIH